MRTGLPAPCTIFSMNANEFSANVCAILAFWRLDFQLSLWNRRSIQHGLPGHYEKPQVAREDLGQSTIANVLGTPGPDFMMGRQHLALETWSGCCIFGCDPRVFRPPGLSQVFTGEHLEQ
jgi:hypothetical protein